MNKKFEINISQKLNNISDVSEEQNQKVIEKKKSSEKMNLKSQTINIIGKKSSLKKEDLFSNINNDINKLSFKEK